MSRLLVSSVAVVALLAGAASPARAFYTYDKLSFMTFSGPVQVPGARLNAGTYRFALANAGTGRNVLHVLSNDGKIVYAMFHTTPDWRAVATKETMVTFRETPAGLPVAVKTLFYGGEHNGYEFVYPRGEPIVTPEVVRQPEVTYTPIPAASPAAAPQPAARPEWEVAVEPMPIEQPNEVQPVAPEPTPAPPAELPKTASPLPFLALGGLTSLLAGLGLLRRRN